MADSKNIALIFAGGVGSRMTGAKTPKQFLEYKNKPIIAYTLERFQNCSSIDAIIIACHKNYITHLQDIVHKFSFNKVTSIVEGGATGQESILNGLEELYSLGMICPCAKDHDCCVVSGGQCCGCDRFVVDDKLVNNLVLVHDGVRPFIDDVTIEDCIKSINNNGCTATCSPAIETIIETKNGTVENVIDRSICQLARAPQGFYANALYYAHRLAQKEGLDDFIDSISLMNHFGHEIFTIKGPSKNIKITTPEDFFVFKAYVDMEEEQSLWDL